MSEPLSGGIVVVGASAAGLTAAETLRRDGYAGKLTLIGDEIHPPYDRPPLSKQVLKGTWDPARTVLRRPEALDSLGATWLLGTPATALDTSAKMVSLADGGEVGYDKLVIATGVRARVLPGQSAPRTWTLRTVDDAETLAREMRAGASIAVIGSGFLGAEAAAVAVELGMDVTMIDVVEAPMLRQLGTALALRIARLHAEKGVAMLFGVGVEGMTKTGERTRLRLSDGAILDVDMVLIAVGSHPNTEWLTSSGLDLTDGVVCDQHSLVSEDIAAAGDVARWFHPGLGRHLRVEHRMNATEQGTIAARNILGAGETFAPIPYFWTDQYDVKIQAYGFVSGDAELEVVSGSIDDDRFAAVYRKDGRVTGALTWNLPREARELRGRVAEGLSGPVPGG